MRAETEPAPTSVSITSWVRRCWPVWVSMLVASVVFSWAVSIYPPLPIQKDALEYSGYAKVIADRGTFAGPDGKPTAFRTPLYPLFLSGFYRAEAVGMPLNTAAKVVQPHVIAAQLTLAVATVGLIAAIGCIMAGSGLGLAAGLMAALYLPFAWASSVLFSENLAVFLLCIQLLFAVRLADKKRSLRATDCLAFGVATGLLVLTRPEFVLWAPVPVIFAVVLRRASPRRLATTALLALAGFTLVMCPWWIRNVVSLHRVVLLSTMTSTLTPATHPGNLVERARNAVKTASRPYVAAELAYGNERLTPGKPQVTFGPLVSETPKSLMPAEEWTKRFHMWLLAFALVGLVFARRWPQLLMVFSLPLYIVAVDMNLIFHERHFFTVMPAVIVLAAAGVWGLITVSARLLGGHGQLVDKARSLVRGKRPL